MRYSFAGLFILMVLVLATCIGVARRSYRKIGKAVAMLLAMLIPPVIGNLIIILASTKGIAMIGCYIYFIGMDAVIMALLHFTFDYCVISWPNRALQYSVYGLVTLDVVQFLLNPVMSFLTIILAAAIFIGLLVYELIRRKNPYRPVLLFPFSIPLIFAFYCQVSLEVLANHKFIQVSLILFDILIAGLLANLLALPIKVRAEAAEAQKEEGAEKEKKTKKIALKKNVFIPVQIGSAVVCLLLLFGLTATGISEWFIYYNLNTHKGGYVELHPDSQIAEWVTKNTNEDDIFLTPMWSVNDFFLSGRRIYYGWPYFAWSAGHDTEVRQINYQWLLTGANGNINEFRRYCNEMNIRYVITSNDYYGNGETRDYYDEEFFERNLTEMVRFDDGTVIYRV